MTTSAPPPQKLLIPLTQQYIPKVLTATTSTSSSSTSTPWSGNTIAAVPPSSSSPSSLALHQHQQQHSNDSAATILATFDRSTDSTCNFATPLSINSGTASSSTSYGHHHQQQQQMSAAASDIAAVTWLPEIVTASSQAASQPTNGIRSSAGGAAPSSSSMNSFGSAVSSSSSTATTADAWCLGILPNGSIRAVCASAGTTNLIQNEILPLTPAEDIARVPSSSSSSSAAAQFFSGRANALCAFHTPQGYHNTSSASVSQQQQQQNTASSAPPPPPKPRGRGTVNPTAPQASLIGAATTKHFSNRRNMISVICFRGGQLHALLLDCPDHFQSLGNNTGSSAVGGDDRGRRGGNTTSNTNQRRGGADEGSNTNLLGVHGLKTVLHHSLGKHTGPSTSVFHSVDGCQIEYVQVENNNNNSNNTSASGSSSPQQQQQQLYPSRHFMVVHCTGRSVASKGSEKISAIACFEIQRKSEDSLTVEVSASSNNFLAATTVLDWTLVGGGNASLVLASSSSSSSATAGGESTKTKEDSAEATNNNKFTSTEKYLATKCASLVSLSVLGTSTGASGNDLKILIAMAHSGSPAVVRIGAIGNIPLSSSSSKVGAEFTLCGQSLSVNSKQSIFRLRTLTISNQTNLVAVLTNDNIIQVFCCTFRSTSSAIGETATGGGADAGRRRQRDDDGDNDAGNSTNQYLLESVSTGRSGKNLTANNNNCWPLFASRRGDDDQQQTSSVGNGNNNTDDNISFFATSVCAISPPGATASNPVDDLSLVPSTILSHNNNNNNNNVVVEVTIMAQLSTGLLQTFSLFSKKNSNSAVVVQQQQELPKLEKSESLSVLFPPGADAGIAKCSASWPCVVTSSSSSSLSSPGVPNVVVRSPILVQVFGSHILVLKPKKQ